MVFDPTLFSYASHVDQRRVRVRTLVVTLGGFVDAGHTQRLLVDHLRNTLTSHRLGAFDVDRLVDYRENRPRITFDRDHFTDYAAPEMTLEQFADEAGEAFLLIDGPEPALRWAALIETVKHMIDELSVERVVVLDSIPLPSPHTRPVLVTKHASDARLIPNNRSVFGQILMSASFTAALEQQLGAAGIDVVGLTAHVPQYLADNDFPDAPVALITELRNVTGLRIPTQTLAIAAGIVRAQIGTQIEQSEELTEMVHAMEEQYDQAVDQLELTRRAEEELPDADEIGEEAEAFLRDMGLEDPADDEPTPDSGADPRPDPDRPAEGTDSDDGPSA